MELKKIIVDSLSVSEVLSLLEIAQGFSLERPDWKRLKQELARYDAWGFYDREELFGYALVNCRSPYFEDSIQIAELKYRWQYNQEAVIARIICALARVYQNTSNLVVMDVDIRHDINCGLYKKIGFTTSVMRSPLDRNRAVLLSNLDSLLKNGFSA
ncbi:MAG: hypothetical protein ACI4EX_04710 [Lachnospiraceae bacterium]